MINTKPNNLLPFITIFLTIAKLVKLPNEGIIKWKIPTKIANSVLLLVLLFVKPKDNATENASKLRTIAIMIEVN